MNKFILLNPALREIICDEKIRKIEQEINKYRLTINFVDTLSQNAIFQPEGQSIVVFTSDDENGYVICSSCEVPLDQDVAQKLSGQIDESEWKCIWFLEAMEKFPCYRIDYFRSKGKSVDAQVKSHNEIIEAGLVDAVVQIIHTNSNDVSLVEIYAGRRYTCEY